MRHLIDTGDQEAVSFVEAHIAFIRGLKAHCPRSPCGCVAQCKSDEGATDATTLGTRPHTEGFQGPALILSRLRGSLSQSVNPVAVEFNNPTDNLLRRS